MEQLVMKAIHSVTDFRAWRSNTVFPRLRIC